MLDIEKFFSMKEFISDRKQKLKLLDLSCLREERGIRTTPEKQRIRKN